MVRALFSVLIRLADVSRSLNCFLISPLSFPPLYLLLSSIWLCLNGSLTLAEHHLESDGLDLVASSRFPGRYDFICMSRHNGPGRHFSQPALVEG